MLNIATEKLRYFNGMKKALTFLFLTAFVATTSAQSLSGTVVDAANGQPIKGVIVTIDNGKKVAKTDANGNFTFKKVEAGTHDVHFAQARYLEVATESTLNANENTQLNIEMNYDTQAEMREDIYAALAEVGLDDAEGESQYVSSVLVSRGDVFSSAASFAFSPVRFRLRGYSNYMPYESTYINGVNFNEQERGRFNYSSLGGLNDASRNKESVGALETAYYSFGNIGISTNINMRASQFAAGTKVGLSGTNRSYWLRAMATHATGVMDNGWALAASAAYRWAHEGRTEGTFYNSGAYFFSAEKFFDDHHSINIVTYGAPTERSNSSALTQETVDLTSIYYNPYWGYQDGKKRNSRIVHSFDPTLIFNHDWRIDNSQNLRTGIAAHYSMYSNSALTFYNAPDPRPDYYRNLPSAQLGGWALQNGEYFPSRDETNVELYNQMVSLWQEHYGVKNDNTVQIDWNGIYNANYANNQNNPNGIAKYMLERRHNNSLEVALNSTYDNQVNEYLKVIAGVEAKYTKGIHYKTVDDLLGANQWIDIDPFADRDINDLAENVAMTQAQIAGVRQNDIENPNKVVKEGDKFGYHYDINVYKAALFAMNEWDFNHLKFGYALKLTYSSFNRFGYMENGRAVYLSQVLGEKVISKGLGATHHFIDPAFKAHIEYAINGRNKLSANFAAETRAPLPDSYYISSRIYDRAVSDLSIANYDRGNALMNFYGLSEKILAYDLTYNASFPFVKARVSVFGTHSKDGIERIGYYNDEYRTFINHTMIDVDKMYLGVEAGASFKLSPMFTLSAVVGYTHAQYTDNAIGIETAENGMKINGEQEYADRILIKDLKPASGPQLVSNLKLNFFHPDMWFAELGVSYFDYNYLGIAPSRFSQGIMTGTRADGTTATMSYTDEQRAVLGTQERLDDAKWYNRLMLDASVGKVIYLKGGKSININLSLANLTNNTHIKTGGYQQARIPTMVYRQTTYKVSDNVNKYPSKFYYAWGFNFFLNIGFKF